MTMTVKLKLQSKKEGKYNQICFTALYTFNDSKLVLLVYVIRGAGV